MIKRTHVFSLFAALIIALSLFATDVYACQCRERKPPCAQYGDADVVFVGSVARITRAMQVPRDRINFSIERAVKGLSGNSVELVGYGSSCDYGFAEGQTYLVYAYRNSKTNELYTYYCTRTTELSNATADLAFFDLPSEKRQSPQIVGVLRDNDMRLRKVSVVASGSGGNYRTTTDNEGWFTLKVPRPGKYRVRVSLPLYADVVGTTAELDEISNRVLTKTGITIEYETVVEADKCGFINPPLYIDRSEYEKSLAQKANTLEIEHWRDVLRAVKRELKENYYDPNFHGIDIEARFKVAEEKMKSAESMAQLEKIVAQFVLELNDNHTFFMPPTDGSRIEYGWRLVPVGDDSYVGAVKPGSDAWAKGLRPGDKVLSIDGRPLDRKGIWLADYLNYTLESQETITLVVEKPDHTQQKFVIHANVSKRIGGVIYADLEQPYLKRVEEYRPNRHDLYELSDEVMLWKMPQFYLDEYDLADIFGKLKKHKALILDLRGNSRGFPNTLPHFAGYFFDSNLKLADRRGRKDLQPILAKSKKEKSFKGRLVVLIDGESASAAEIFARTVQLQKRGVVIGDRSSGSVMEGKLYPMHVGLMRAIPCALSATSADVIMPDGTRLEHIGVVPDTLVLPTADDLRASNDPVLAYAASLVGIELDPKKAGAMYPTNWKSK